MTWELVFLIDDPVNPIGRIYYDLYDYSRWRLCVKTQEGYYCLDSTTGTLLEGVRKLRQRIGNFNLVIEPSEHRRIVRMVNRMYENK